MTLKLDNSIPKDPYTKQLCSVREPVDKKRHLKFANAEVEGVYCVQEEHEQRQSWRRPKSSQVSCEEGVS